jgi:hypothetical protein
MLQYEPGLEWGAELHKKVFPQFTNMLKVQYLQPARISFHLWYNSYLFRGTCKTKSNHCLQIWRKQHNFHHSVPYLQQHQNIYEVIEQLLNNALTWRGDIHIFSFFLWKFETFLMYKVIALLTTSSTHRVFQIFKYHEAGGQSFK